MANDSVRIKTGGKFYGAADNEGSEWDCPYCHGSGQDPYRAAIGEKCPACHGHRVWQSRIKYSDLSRCDRCDGTGKTNFRGDWVICSECMGSGRL